MSASRREKPSDRKSKDRKADTGKPTARRAGKSKPAEPPELKPIEAEELPELEPIEDDEIPELEPIDGSPVNVECKPADEPALDTCLAVDVPEMDKSAVAEAVDGPLRRSLAQNATSLRHKRVVVQFGGAAMIGTAVKDLVGELLKGAKALKVVVRRGYGDENVYEGKLPVAKLSHRTDGNTVRVDVDASGLEAADLPMAMEQPLQQLAADAGGKSFAFAFAGIKPDDALKAHLQQVLAGADRLAIGDTVLFDRELERRVQVTVTADERRILVTPAEDEKVTLAAIAMVLKAADFAQQHVRVQVAERALRSRELAALMQLCKQGKPARLELERAGDAPDVLWPPLLQRLQKDGELLLQVVDNGRNRSALAAAFRREADELQAEVAGKPVVLDWPADFSIDASIERDCLAAIGALAPKSIACSFAGDNREPYLPVPVSIGTADDGTRRIKVDTDAGKPPELVRAIERRLQLAGADLRGQQVLVEFTGAAAASRSMLRAVRESIERSGAARLVVDDHGNTDVLLPALLRIEKTDAGVRVTANADDGGRDATQQEHALQRELDGADIPAGAAFVVAPSALAPAIVTAAVGRLARSVVLDQTPPVQVHPPLLAAPRRDGDDLFLTAAPGIETAVVAAQIAHELPPLLAAIGDLAEIGITVLWPGASGPKEEPVAQLLRQLIAAAPLHVRLDTGAGKPIQVYPIVVPDYVRVLGKKDAASPPLLMLGIDDGEGEEHDALVLQKLAELGANLDGRAVLLVRRDHGRDAPFTDAFALGVKAREVIDARAAATLCFRGLDTRRQPWFEVVHSNVATLTAGARIADPRPRA